MWQRTTLSPVPVMRLKKVADVGPAADMLDGLQANSLRHRQHQVAVSVNI